MFLLYVSSYCVEVESAYGSARAKVPILSRAHGSKITELKYTKRGGYPSLSQRARYVPTRTPVNTGTVMHNNTGPAVKHHFGGICANIGKEVVEKR